MGYKQNRFGLGVEEGWGGGAVAWWRAPPRGDAPRPRASHSSLASNLIGRPTAVFSSAPSSPSRSAFLADPAAAAAGASFSASVAAEGASPPAAAAAAAKVCVCKVQGGGGVAEAGLELGRSVSRPPLLDRRPRSPPPPQAAAPSLPPPPPSEEFREAAADPCRGFPDADNVVPGACRLSCRCGGRGNGLWLGHVASPPRLLAQPWPCRHPPRPPSPCPPPARRLPAGPAAGQGRLLLGAQGAARADGAGGGVQDHRKGQAQGAWCRGLQLGAGVWRLRRCSAGEVAMLAAGQVEAARREQQAARSQRCCSPPPACHPAPPPQTCPPQDPKDRDRVDREVRGAAALRGAAAGCRRPRAVVRLLRPTFPLCPPPARSAPCVRARRCA